MRNRLFAVLVFAVLLTSCSKSSVSILPVDRVEMENTVTFSMRLYWEDSVTGETGFNHRIVAEVPVASLWAVCRVRGPNGEILAEWEWDTGILPYVVGDDSGPGSGPYGDPVLFVITTSDYPQGETLTASGQLFWRVEGEEDIPCVADSADEVGLDGFSLLGDFVGSGVEVYQVFMPLIVRRE